MMKKTYNVPNNIKEDEPLLTSSSKVINSDDGIISEDTMQEKPAAKGASLEQTSLNIVKTCVGTGTLVLPFAASEGGLLFSIFGVIVVAVWNLFSVNRLIKSAKLLSIISPDDSSSFMRENRRTLSSKRRFFQGTNDEERVDIHSEDMECCPEGTATFGKVAFHSFGFWGLHFSDLLLLIMFIGIIISLIVLVEKLTIEANFSTGSFALDLSIIAVTIILLSSFPDLGFLYIFSAMGILAVVASFILIFIHGLNKFGLDGFTGIKWEHLWPKNFKGVANWFGIVVFSFGIAPLTYNFQESMGHPDQMKMATSLALLFVSIFYVIIGNGVVIIYAPESNYNFTGDVFDHLPISWISTFIRLAMALTTITSIPLVLIPCGDLVYGKLGSSEINSILEGRILIRAIVALGCVIASAMIPDFASVVTFVGSFCVSILCFIYPPLVHAFLSMKANRIQNNRIPFIEKRPFEDSHVHNFLHNGGSEIYLDVVMTFVGIFATIFASYLTIVNE